MQDKKIKKTKDNIVMSSYRLADLTLEDKQNFVGVFAWLIQEDKKQNPGLYRLNKKHD